MKNWTSLDSYMEGKDLQTIKQVNEKMKLEFCLSRTCSDKMHQSTLTLDCVRSHRIWAAGLNFLLWVILLKMKRKMACNHSFCHFYWSSDFILIYSPVLTPFFRHSGRSTTEPDHHLFYQMPSTEYNEKEALKIHYQNVTCVHARMPLNQHSNHWRV